MTILIGLLSGIIAGMGIGGGTLLIPMLTILLSIDQKIAQSTNLICFIPLAFASLPIHAKNKNIDYGVVKKIIPFGILGAILGTYLAINIPSDVLKKIFAVFLFVMGLREIIWCKH
ncbi:MAG: sulfite exporter TauE/SafE family protein [Eubacteriales bacterium]